MSNVKCQKLMIFLPLIFLGVGCEQEIVSDNKTPEQAAIELNLSTGSKIEIRETVLGIGGKFATLFQVTDAPRVITINKYEQGVKATASWESLFNKETEASKAAREQYFKDFKTAPIGTQLSIPPEPIYETIVEKGNLETEKLKDGEKILLPIFWKKDETVGSDSTLVWLSQKQYQELIQTRRTKVNLGLFDESISAVTGFLDQAEIFIDKIKSLGQETISDITPTQPSDHSEIEASIDWKTYRILVNGKLTDVRSIQAQNSFAKYTILANEQNPIILELILTPAARGSANIFSRKSFGEAFWGYEITSILDE